MGPVGRDGITLSICTATAREASLVAVGTPSVALVIQSTWAVESNNATPSQSPQMTHIAPRNLCSHNGMA